MRNVLEVLGVESCSVKCLLGYDSDADDVLCQDGVQGRYLLDNVVSDGFLKKMVLQVRPRINETAYTLSNDVFGCLNALNVNAPALIEQNSGRIIDEYKGYRVALATFRDGHHFDSVNLNEMEVMGGGT